MTDILAAILAILLLVAFYDLLQRRHAVLRNFPILGHFRYLFEMVGPELRQYIVTSNNEERPFSRDQRRWVYASSKRANNYFGFGTDNDLDRSPGYIIVKHSPFPLQERVPGSPDYDEEHRLPCAKVLGGHRKRRKAFRPASVVNVSAMSFGSLSARAVSAINQGCRLAGCWQNSGEGGLAPYHLQGGDLVWQIGTAYFGCRDENGRFSMERLLAGVAKFPVKAIEIKLSQGAKPGLGGVLPAPKVTEEIAAIRGIPPHVTCMSPSGHTEFSDPDSLLDFVESIAERTGLPVGIKSAVGDPAFFGDLARLMATTDRGIDFVTVDGGEGGTGAAPLVFSDHVALPFKQAFVRVYGKFFEQGVHENVVFIGSGRLGFPDAAYLAFALGCDTINVAREAMLAVGCIQAQRCHTGRCPTGVATQSKWLMHGLDPASKAERLHNYICTLRKEILWLCRASGVTHPVFLTPDSCEILADGGASRRTRDVFGTTDGWGVPTSRLAEATNALMASPEKEGPPPT